MIQSCTTMLYVAKLPGNMLINGIVYGCGGTFAMIFSSWLMGRMHDITVFRALWLLGLIGYLVLILFPDNDILPYVGIILITTSIEGWGNTFLLILELRVPPQNASSALVIIKTISIGAAISCPTIANLEQPFTLMIGMCLAFTAVLVTICLPRPGQHLP